MFAVCRSPFAVGERARRRTHRAPCYVDPLDQPRQHLFDVRSCAFQDLGLPWSEKPQILRQENKTNQLVGRTGGNVQKLPEFSAGCPSTPLRDIGGDRGRGSSHLAGQTKSFGIRISGRRAVDTQRQSLAPLPYLQFSEVLHAPKAIDASPARETLAHEYFIKQVLPRVSCRTRPTVHRPSLTSRFAPTANGKLQTANLCGESSC